VTASSEGGPVPEGPTGDARLERAVRREHELEAEIRQAQKMMALGRMTAGIAHDFNNILTVITASADMIEQAVEPGDEELLREVGTLREAADSGATLVGKLMGFSRTVPVHPVPTNLGSLLQRLEPMLDRLLPERIALELVLPAGEIAHCDPKTVEQIVMNLVTNARDALDEAGRIRVTVTERIVDPDDPSRPTWLEPGSFVRISVRDDGSGMDEATRARALEPFFTTKQSGAGTGLGLAMVYGLTKQQGGFLELVSEAGQGTTVHVYFPKPAAIGRKAPKQGAGQDPDALSGDSRSA
jgi:signal transduction histidine kinase